MESPEINLHIQMIFNRIPRPFKDSLFNKLDIHIQKIKIGPLSYIIYTKISSKNLNMRTKIIKLLEGNSGRQLHDNRFDNDLVGLIPKHR